jgi:quinol monooxygenase YgiN
MHARVVEVTVKPESVDEAIKIYETSVVPAVKAIDGYLGGYLFVDRENNKALSIALFESLEKITATAESGHLQDQFAKFGDVLTKPPVTTVYEVTTEVERYSVPSSYH